jgi:hypothetical protein
MLFQRLFLYAVAMMSVIVNEAFADIGIQGVERKLEGAAKVTLVSMEGKSYEVSRNVALMSELVKSMIDDDDDNDDEGEVIPLPNIKSTVLSKVIEFCRHHENNPMKKIEKVDTLCLSSMLDSLMNDLVIRSHWLALKCLKWYLVGMLRLSTLILISFLN